MIYANNDDCTGHTSAERLSPRLGAARLRQTVGGQASDPMNLLLVQDNPKHGNSMAAALRDSGHNVVWTRSTQSAIDAMGGQSFEVILLSLSLPLNSGGDFLSMIRSRRISTPVIALSEQGTLGETLAALDAGADDLVHDSIETSELCARLRAVRRRSVRQDPDTMRLRFGHIEIDVERCSVTAHGTAISVTAREFDVLRLLVLRGPRTVSQWQFAASLRTPANGVSSNWVEVVIHHLRRKLGRSLIITERGSGYRLDRQQAASAR
jgi:DNA-binding response OmpR family regulator